MEWVRRRYIAAFVVYGDYFIPLTLLVDGAARRVRGKIRCSFFVYAMFSLSAIPRPLPQVTLKNYDPQRDKRFSGTFKLPTIPRYDLVPCVEMKCFTCGRLSHPFGSFFLSTGRRDDHVWIPCTDPYRKYHANLPSDDNRVAVIIRNLCLVVFNPFV